MGDFRICADSAIDAFVKELGEPYYPNWAALVPGSDENGWGGDVPNWRKQAAGIIGDFEDCAQVKIDRDRREIDVLRNMTLADFSDYLVEKAQHSAALLAAKVAIAHLEAVRAQHRASGIRS